jgi:hypothetical protein
MKIKAGIWVDHRQATLVKISWNTNNGSLDAQETVMHFASDSESQSRRAGDRTDGPFEPLNVQADDTQQRKHTAELGHYYDEIIENLANVDAVFVMGPGEAKKELHKRLTQTTSIAQIDTSPADKLTEKEVIAAVRKHFCK